MTSDRAPLPDQDLTIVPANEASWDDLVAIFGTADYSGRCQCQRFKVTGWIWRDSTQEQLTGMLRTQTGCGRPPSRSGRATAAAASRIRSPGPPSTSPARGVPGRWRRTR